MAESEPTTPVRERAGELAPGRVVAGRYKLERRLGVGGMAAVWLAIDERLGRPVAVKALAERFGSDGEYRRRFRREAKLAARLQHPNLVGVYDYHAGEQPYLVMEYIEGGTLAGRLAAGQSPPVEGLARELLSALRCIHSAGILHRDVKPQNVLIDASGRARLTDFGIAEDRDATSITRTGIVVGTETYMAPERRRGDPATERSDLYSLGVVLAEVAERDGAGAATWELIERLRSPDPEDRPSSAAAALSELGPGNEVAGEPTRPLPTEPTEAVPPIQSLGDPRTSAHSPRRRTLAIGAIALAALAAVAGVGMALGGGDDSPEEAGLTSDAAGGDAGGAETEGQGDAAAQTAGSSSEGGGNGSAGGSGGGGAADGRTLNDRGHALIEQGRYEKAIPVLQRAVDALRGSGDELYYNYALFNLAHALRLAGRPDEAIPLLEERLRYPNQQDVVAAELQAAREAAGVAPSGEEGSGDASAESGGGGGPPPHAQANGRDDD